MACRRTHWAAGLCAATVVAGCGGGDPERIARALDRLQANCVVILLDACAADHVGAYGYPRGTTPNIDALAAEGVLFERAYSQGAATAVSIPSLFTGLYPQSLSRWGAAGQAPPADVTTGVVRALERWREGQEASPPRFAERFRTAGFRTGAFTANPIVGPGLGLVAGFEHRMDVDREKEGGYASSRLVAGALRWIAEHRAARFFAYVHLLRPHNPYDPPPAVAERFRPPAYLGDLTLDSQTLMEVNRGELALDPEDLEFLVSQYDANLFYADRLVGDVVARLRTLGLLDRTVIVVTSDHGEAFGQHGYFLHSHTLYEEMLRVPLIVRFPPAAGVAPARVRQPVGLVDVHPTLARLFSLPRSAATDGLDLTPLFLRPDADLDRAAIFAQAYTQVARIERDHKYIGKLGATADAAPVREELYDLATDPEERQDRSAAEPGRLAAMRAAVRAFLGGRVVEQSTEAAAASLDDEARRRLKSLGYLDGADGTR